MSPTTGMRAWRVKCSSIEPGLIASERVARIESAEGGMEFVAVSEQLIVGERLEVGWIGALGDRALIELPCETASGRWRMWVKRTLLEPGQDDPHGP